MSRSLHLNAPRLSAPPYYTSSGNLFYVGLASVVPYAGFTWAWQNVQLGLISSLATLFIPMPYLYFRF